MRRYATFAALIAWVIVILLNIFLFPFLWDHTLRDIGHTCIDATTSMVALYLVLIQFIEE